MFLLPLWVTFIVWALLPDSKTPWFKVASIPIDGRYFLIVILAFYYGYLWISSSLKPQKNKKIIADVLAAEFNKPWHEHVTVISILVFIYAGLTLGWSKLDSRNVSAMIYTLILTGASILVSYLLISKSRYEGKVYSFLWSLTIFIFLTGLLYTVFSYFSLFKFAGVRGQFESTVDDSVGRIKGPFFGVAAAYFILMPSIGFTFQRFMDGKGNKLINLIAIFSLILTLVGTGSRGGLISFALFIVMLFLAAKDKKKAAISLITLILVISTAFFAYYNRSESVATRVQSFKSSDRELTYSASYEIVTRRALLQNLFGSGYASYWPWYLPQIEGRNRDTGLVWVPYGSILFKPHSVFLMLTVELGLVGFLYYLWLWMILLKLYFLNIKNSKLMFLNCSLAASFIATFFDTPLIASPSESTTWWLFFMGTLSLNSEREK